MNYIFIDSVIDVVSSDLTEVSQTINKLDIQDVDNYKLFKCSVETIDYLNRILHEIVNYLDQNQ